MEAIVMEKPMQLTIVSAVPLLIAGALRILPETWRASLFAQAPQPPDGFGADYFLLGLNLVLF